MAQLFPFTVVWVEPEPYQMDFYNCMATDHYDAQLKCEEMYPDADVLWVNEGHNNTRMEESLEEICDPL